MSSKELSLKDKDFNLMSAWIGEANKLVIGVNSGCGEHGIISLDRNQAHLLKLWLEEHLK